MDTHLASTPGGVATWSSHSAADLPGLICQGPEEGDGGKGQRGASLFMGGEKEQKSMMAHEFAWKKSRLLKTREPLNTGENV